MSISWDELPTDATMIHQPHFAPWPGYFARALAARHLVVLDNVQFRKNYFQNRTLIFTRSGNARWLTLPVKRSRLGTQVREMSIAPTFNLKSMSRRLGAEYGLAPCYAQTWPNIVRDIEAFRPNLMAVNVQIISDVLREISRIRMVNETVIDYASSFTNSDDRTQRLVDICSGLNVATLILGSDAIRAHDVPRLWLSGIRIFEQQYVGSSAVRGWSMRPSAELSPGVAIHHYAALHGWESVTRAFDNWRFIEHG
jgi:WbqC-like protein family